MRKQKIGVFLILFLFFACRKTQQAPDADFVSSKPSLSDCDQSTDEYVKGSFNNNDICFSSLQQPDTFYNAYYKTDRIDHIVVVRNNLNNKMACELHLVNTDLHHKKLPYSLPGSATSGNEYGEILINNLGQGTTVNNYEGDTYKGFKITITDTSSSSITGYFSGTAATKSGRNIAIDKGDFFIRLINVNSDLH